MNNLGIFEMFKTFFKTMILLLTVFSLHFTFLDGIITVRILTIGIVALIYVIRKSANLGYNLNDRNRNINWIFINFILLAYIFLVSFINNTIGQPYSVLRPTINFCVFCVFFVIISAPLFEDAVDFAKCMTYAASIQSVIAIFSFLFPGFREFLCSIQILEMWRYSYRVVGLGVVGAGGSMYLACGMITALFLLLKGKKSMLLYFQILILFVGIALVGRTGLYYSIGLAIMYYCITHITYKTSGLNLKIKQIRLGLIIALISFFSLVIVADLRTSFLSGVMFKYTFGRMFGIFTETNTYVASSFLNTIPGLSMKTVLGTGLTAGNIDGINVFLDSGYAERYLSYGLIMAFISYFTFGRQVYGWNKKLGKETKMYLNTALVLLFIIEYKEPFIFMLACPYVLLMLGRLDIQRLNKKFLGEANNAESS